MEVDSNGPETRALTPLRILRGVCCLLVLLSTAFVILVYCGFLTAVILRLFSIHYSRKATAFFFGSWLALWPLLFEKINKTKVIFSGESVPARERVLIIANHRTEVDWMYLWDLALRKGRLGYIKYILKSSLMKLPVFGWAFQILEFISVERKWEVDESPMRQMLSTFKNHQDPLWLAVFPEGTDFTEQKCIRSQKFASENGLPILHNVLLPKTKGFAACVEELRGCLDAVYDITIGYKYRCPTFLDNAFGVAPSEVHIHVRRIIANDIPASEEMVGSWLMDTFSRKDKLLVDFQSRGCFPHQGTEGDLPTISCLVNAFGVIIFTSICMFLTFFSSVWFKAYIVLVCAYLGSATYFNIRPDPIFAL
ncbi:probable 1-acyl-sn-glycerol-3-phosphate acyltransferase 5 [Cynara cardunculus var. scolymus]|uniref:probable 1-acyl-sn-glycerol-3-phosphate acyltransferase 5 n=1 Tax=Cynara cardunculus var. scolymus TaxID=59895 RepID=UPI000D631005|nr:probable 1-acyl-sn-glycerol-3-phosphate acyltransferase 5 [Cynara cardunculus var. scolymus]